MENCNCANQKIIPDVNTPKGSKHIKGCPLLKPYLFYFEEAVNAWVPAPKEVSAIIDTDNLGESEDQEIKFKRFDMTEDEFANLPLD
jgi:hypothetical protein